MIKSEHFEGLTDRKIQWLQLWHIGSSDDNICGPEIELLFGSKMVMGYQFKANISSEFLYVTMIGC